MKIVTIILVFTLISFKSFSQEEVRYQKDSALPVNVTPVGKIKHLDLGKQQTPVKKYKSKKGKKVIFKSNTSIKDEKKDQLEAILTPEQKEKIKQTKDNKPRRGVTTMPNERTAK